MKLLGKDYRRPVVSYRIRGRACRSSLEPTVRWGLVETSWGNSFCINPPYNSSRKNLGHLEVPPSDCRYDLSLKIIFRRQEAGSLVEKATNQRPSP